MRITPEFGDVSIVLLGNLNPRIFRPDWFAATGLVSGAEAGAAEIEIIHPEITIFNMDWLSLRVEPQRFQAISDQAPFVRLADLVVRVFREFLGHTPAGAMGINRQVHFSVGDDETRDRIGHILAPQEPWGEWAPMIMSGEGENHGGMASLIMVQRDLQDRYEGHIQAKVEPSTMLKSGIYMHVNDHYVIENADKVVGCDEIISILERVFESSIQRSEWIIDQIMALK